MKRFNQTLTIAAFALTLTANAVDFRIGPKIGLGIGSPTGVKDTDAKIALAPVIGALGQFDFGNMGLDIGLNYRYNVFGFSGDVDVDDDGISDGDGTLVLSYSSFEIPVTAYYKLNVGSRGFFKFGGGAGLDLGFGKVKSKTEVEFLSITIDNEEKQSFSDAGLKQVDLYAIAHLGYEVVFDAWALSVDLQPKYGLINKAKDSDNGKWHTFWVDLGVGFLF